MFLLNLYKGHDSSPALSKSTNTGLVMGNYLIDILDPIKFYTT